jgi:hypothetical protein
MFLEMNISPDLKVGRRIGSPSSRHTSKHSIEIHNRNIVNVGSLRTIDVQNESFVPEVLGTPPDSLIMPSPLQTSKFDQNDESVQIQDVLETPSDNIDIRSFDVKSDDVKNIVVDTGFLKHVISVLISNHGITTDVKDLEDIFGYYGDVEIKTQKQYVQKRGTKKRGICSNVDLDDVIDVVQKVVVNGINILKKVPDFIGYLETLGIRF